MTREVSHVSRISQVSDEVHVYLHEPICHQIDIKGSINEAGKDLIRALSDLGREVLMNAGLRREQIEGVIISASPLMTIKTSFLAGGVIDQMEIQDAQDAGFGGPFALYHALLFAYHVVRGRHLSHLLLMHVEAESTTPKSLSAYAVVVGSTPTFIRMTGVALGRVKASQDLPPEEVVQQRLHVPRDELSVMRWSLNPIEQGFGALLDAINDSLTATALIGARSGRRWSAAAFEVTATPSGGAPAADDLSLNAVIKRARRGGFALSLLRVSGEPIVKSPYMMSDRLRSVLRAFDSMLMLPDKTVLLLLPRAEGQDLWAIRERIEQAVEPQIVTFHSITLRPRTKEVTLEEIEWAIQTKLPDPADEDALTPMPTLERFEP